MTAGLKRFGILVATAAMVGAMAAAQSRQESLLHNPYERPKNGPPLTDVFYKVKPAWLLEKLRKPKHHLAARMPDFRLTEEEALDVMAYLKSIAQEPVTRTQWPAWAAKETDAMSEDEQDAMFKLVDRGKILWRNARCTICHTLNGPGGELIGGFVDLRVGGIDLQIAATKLRRDWLYAWIKEPTSYFADTLMPRFRLSDDEIKALVEYILRDEAFYPVTEEEKRTETPERWSVLDHPERLTRGKRLIELSRCVICHDINGIPELLSQPERKPPPPVGTFEFLAYDLRCLTCHSIKGRGGTYAPDLTSEGSRIREEWIAQFVASPDIIRPLLQQMPKFNIASQEAKIIASYITRALRDAQIPADIPGALSTPDEIERGRNAFKARGCFSCHNSGEGPGGVVGPNLATVGDRLRPGYLWFHLKNPRSVNPYAPEPNYGLSDEEAGFLAAYLSTRKK